MIKSLEDVQPGDLFLGPIGGLVGAGVRLGELAVDGGWRVGDVDVRHMGVVVEASRRMPPGTMRDRTTGRYYLPNDTIPDWRTIDTYVSGVITAPRMAQAMPRGAEIVDMTVDRHWNARCAYARMPEDYPGQAADAAAVAIMMAEARIPYSFLSYPALALYRIGYQAPGLTEWIGRRREPVPIVWPSGRQDSRTGHLGVALPCQAICSVLADQAWSLAGKRVMQGTAPMAVTPSMLAQRLLTATDGVVWGWPVRYPVGAW